MNNINKIIDNQSIKKTWQILLLNSILFTFGCKKLLEVNPATTSITAQNVYSNNSTAAAVLTGLYTNLSASGITSTDLTSIGLISGLSSDELTLYSGANDTRLQAYYQNNLKGYLNYDFWETIYKELYITNLSIEGLNKSSGLTPIVKQQLIGEAKFFRAFCYFYLINLYGDVPLVLETDYSANSVLSRSSQEKIWGQIISDLIDAKSLLSSDYLNGTILSTTTERVRPTRWAAIALLARSYLYVKDWKNAEAQSSEIINNTSLYSMDSINKSFLLNNREAIWQLQPVNFGSNTEDAKTYIIPATGPSFFTPVYLSTQLLNSFENGDLRKKTWIDSIVTSNTVYYFPFKYKSGSINSPLTEYHTILRLAEQYLIRAEARVQQNNFNESRNDLNIIRKRAGLKESIFNDKPSLLSAIYHERQVELFTEWGHRWLDLKRTEQVNTVMEMVTPLKGGTWNSNWQLYPVSPMDIITDANLTQNPGY